MLRLLLLGCLLTTAFGCTSRQWYDGLQQGQRNECLKRPVPQQAECLDAVNLPYDEYRRERKAVLESKSS
jgi:hypothetical protein